MAQELSLSLNFAYVKNGVGINKAYDALYDVDGNYNMTGVIMLGATQESLPLGDIPTPLGYVFIRNIDDPAVVPSRNCAVGGRTDKPIVLLPGQWMLAPWTGIEVMCIAVNGTPLQCLIEYAAINSGVINLTPPPRP